MKWFIFILLFFCGTVVFGEGKHGLSTITGTGIDLKSYDHAFAGSVKDFVVWGMVDESDFSSSLIARKYGTLVKVEFKRKGDKIGGRAEYLAEGKKITHRITLKGIDPGKKTITLLLDGEPLVVNIQPESFDSKTRHFVNPAYSFTIGGQKVSFRLKGGDACFGLSIHYSMLFVMAWVI